MKFLLCSVLFSFANIGLWAQQKEFGWLLGTWKLRDKNAYEIWSSDNDQKTLNGISYRVKDGSDTTVTEEIKLRFQDGAFFYVPDVAGDQGPVPFKITKHGASGFTAENPDHDFPKVIQYNLVRKNNQDTLEASISGNGKTISYTFVRLR